MAVPTIETVHIDAAMTQVSVKYRDNRYVAEEIFPRVGVAKKSDKYFIHDHEHLRDDADDLRRPGDTAKETRWSLSQDNYSAEGHSRTGVLPDEVRDNSDPAVQAEIRTTELATSKILLVQELAFRDIVQDFTTTFNGANTTDETASKWDVATNDAVKRVDTAKVTTLKNSGEVPNVGLCTRHTANAIKNAPDMIDRFKFVNSPAGPRMTDANLATIFELDKVVIADSLLNSADFAATRALDFILGKHFWLFWVPPSPGLNTVAFAYTFLWTAAGGQSGMIVERERATGGRRSTLFHTHKYYDQKVVDRLAGFCYQNVVS